MDRIIRTMSIPLYMKKEGKWFKYKSTNDLVSEIGYYVNLYTLYEEITDAGLIQTLENEEEW